MYKNKYSAQESLQRIKLMMGYDMAKTATENIMEQLYYPSKESENTNKSEEEKIGDEIIGAVDGPGTNVKNLELAFNKIKNATQYFNINAYILKKRGLDIAGTINDELGAQNLNTAQNIVNKLKELGITATFTPQGSQGMSPGSFKITAIPTKKQSELKKEQVPIPAELKDKNGVMVFQNWLDGNHAGWATGYRDGILKQGANGGGYGSFGPRTQKAWSQYGKEYLTKPAPEVVNNTPGTPTQTQTTYQMSDKTKQAAAAAGLT